MKKLIYISHPSLGKEENTLDIEIIIRKLYECDYLYDNFCFVSPVHCYGFMYHDVEYLKGLTFCTDLLEHCDEMWVFGHWQDSRGCTAEIKLADSLGIKVRFLGYSEDIDTTIGGLVRQLKRVSNVPTEKYFSTKSNKRLYTCISVGEYKESCKDNSFFVNRVLYDNLSNAIEAYNMESKLKQSPYYKYCELLDPYDSLCNASKYSRIHLEVDDENIGTFVVLQVDINARKVFNMSSEKDVDTYNEYVRNRDALLKRLLMRSGFNQAKLLDDFIEEKGDIDLIKRVVEIKSHAIKMPLKVKNVYSIVNADCIIDYKKFMSKKISKVDDRYIITDKHGKSLED